MLQLRCADAATAASASPAHALGSAYHPLDGLAREVVLHGLLVLSGRVDRLQSIEGLRG